MPSTTPKYHGVRILFFVVTVLALSGCSIKLIYNNADRLIRWEVDDFVDFSRSQRAYFDADVAQFLYWHRKTQLPLYAEMFARVPGEVEDGISTAEFQALAATAEGWGQVLEERALPIAIQILLSLSPTQADRLPGRLAKANEKFLEDERNKTLAQDQKRWRKAVAKGFKRFIGRLNTDQQMYLADMAAQYRSERDLWVAYRMRWQAQMLNLVQRFGDQGLDAQGFADAMVTLAASRKDYYGEFAEVSQANRALGAQVSGWLLSNLTPTQRTRFNEAMQDIAQDLAELAADLPAPPLQANCLVQVIGCPEPAG